MEVPNKVKNLVWWAGKEAQPIKFNLLRRKTTTDATCEQCKIGIENSSHALFFCMNLHGIWDSVFQWQRLFTLQDRSSLQIFHFAVSNNKEMKLLAIIGWAIWNSRNQLHLNQEAYPLSESIRVSKD